MTNTVGPLGAIGRVRSGDDEALVMREHRIRLCMNLDIDFSPFGFKYSSRKKN